MPTKISAPQPLSDSTNDTSPLLKQIIENRLKKEKKLIDEINAKFNKKREEVLKTFDIKEAGNYLEKEHKTFDSFFGRVGENVARLEPMKKALRKEIQKNALKRFAGFRELALINSENTTNLERGLLANFVLGDHLRGPLSDPEIFLPVDNPYHEVAPPFNFSEAYINNEGYSFNEDNSFPWADWGILDNNVRYKDSNGFFDFGSPNKYAWSSVAVGCNFTVPQEGMMDVSIVLSILDNQIKYSASDNFGPSVASFDISNMIFVEVSSEGAPIGGPGSEMIHVHRRSDGDDISDTITPIAPGRKFAFNFRVGPVHEGQPVEIIVASWFRVCSTSYNMDIDITGSVLWKVEHIYVRVQ